MWRLRERELWLWLLALEDLWLQELEATRRRLLHRHLVTLCAERLIIAEDLYVMVYVIGWLLLLLDYIWRLDDQICVSLLVSIGEILIVIIVLHVIWKFK